MKRIIPKKILNQAYKIDGNEENLIDEKTLSFQEKTEKLPPEIFQIVGNIVSFIEEVNNLEGENENK